MLLHMTEMKEPTFCSTTARAGPLLKDALLFVIVTK